MIVQEYDLQMAVCAAAGLIYNKTDWLDTDHIADDAAIVTTDDGKFHCRSFQDRDANVYMDVQRMPH